ncbi:MAG TPA: hypothetical protein VE270_02095 [Thermoleophilaceae bacterium]|nr:hypothetical protein [Thermoleophilaceae bacterium]
MLTRTYTYLTALLHKALHEVRERLRGDSGQTAAEYLGVIVLIAAILAAIGTTGIGEKLTGLISDAIENVFESN